MTDVIKEHALSLFSKNTREDGRKLDEYRKDLKIELGVSSKSAEGSARVTLGETVVIAGVKLEVTEPFPDTPDAGAFMVNTELIPLSSPDFESGPPSINSIELSRVTDRVLRESEFIDFKKLCLKKGEKAWMILIDIYPINNAGNLFDVAYIAALAALKDAKFPKLDKENKIDYSEHTKTGLPLNKDFPMSCTVLKSKNFIYVDPTDKEEEIADARLTIGLTSHDEICALQKGGETGLTIPEIDKMISLAITKTKELRKLIK